MGNTPMWQSLAPLHDIYHSSGINGQGSLDQGRVCVFGWLRFAGALAKCKAPHLADFEENGFDPGVNFLVSRA